MQSAKRYIFVKRELLMINNRYKNMKTFLKTVLFTMLGVFTSFLLLSVVLLIVVAIWAEPFASSNEEIKTGTVLEINMSELIVDSPQMLSLSSFSDIGGSTTAPISLLSAYRALESAAEDPKITALSLRMDGVNGISLAHAEEIRGAIRLFRERSGKPVFSYAEDYSQVEYYLASVADTLSLHPLGSVEWQGVAMSSYYLGGLFKELGVDVEAFRPEACQHKSAVEPFTRSNQSSESREQSQRLVDVLWSGVVGEVAVARDIKAEELRRIAAEEVSVLATDAVKLKMIDRVGYRDEYDAMLERAGIIRNDKGVLRRVTLGRYAENQAVEAELSPSESSQKIAIIYADGDIVDGTSELGSSPLVGSVTLSSQLRRAREDKDVKGVILRVNSPGGSAMAADVMWREVELLRESKPVIISMGSYAASGGYYISAPSDMIVANKYTITGSIGVYGLIFSTAETFSRNLKINIDGAKSSPSADFGRTPRVLNATERRAVMRSVDGIYDTFTTKVSEGRNLPMGVVSTLSGGRVWSGIEAESNGLVDAIGGLHSALSLAITRSSISKDDYKIVEILEEPTGLDLFFSMLGVRVRAMFGDCFLSSLFGVSSSGFAMPAEVRTMESAPQGLVMRSWEQLVF